MIKGKLFFETDHYQISTIVEKQLDKVIYIVPQEFLTISSGAIFTCRLYLVFPEFFTSVQIMFATFIAMPVKRFSEACNRGEHKIKAYSFLH